MLTKTIDETTRTESSSGSAGVRVRVPWQTALVYAIPAALYYAALLAKGSAHFFDPIQHGLTFNSMLLHMLNGSFDVDPQTIGDEGFLRDGRVYAYFGIFPAILRLPFVVSANFATTDLMRLSCLAAVTVMAFFKLASAFTVWRAVGSRDRSIVLTLFTIVILLSGPQIQFLRVTIYQEVLLWAGALSAAFVYTVVRGYYSERGFTAGILCGLALIAGLCLLTRVSTAVGLFIAFGLLWLVLVWRALRRDPYGVFQSAVLARFIAPAAILSGFVLVTGFVNYERWGNPFTFADFRLYLWPVINHDPSRIFQSLQYGEFNLVRLGFGLAYYFLPLWVVRAEDGSLWWSAFQQRTIDDVELPPSSFFISDPLIIGLAAFALFQLIWNRRAFDRAVVVPVLVGLAVPAFLMLCFVGMTFRYRMEFYPFFELCAFLGFGALVARRAKPPVLVIAILAFASVMASHALLLLHLVSPPGPAAAALGGMDVISFFQSQLR